jgi:hypothetical protein
MSKQVSERAMYHANHATFELPAQLKDKTMHMFTLRDDGPSEFNVVVSHADVKPEEQLDQFGERLTKELTRVLPRFQLAAMTARRRWNWPTAGATRRAICTSARSSRWSRGASRARSRRC